LISIVIRMYKHWLRHTACVPKGFLRYSILEMLSEKPMSGSEIISEFENKTHGYWKPSPGSIYPLLSWLQDKGLLKELPREESGVKRYTLTELGKKFLKEEAEVGLRMKKGLKFLSPPFFGGLWFSLHPGRNGELRDSVRKLFVALFDLRATLEEKFSEKALKEVKGILDETSEKIEDINRKLRGEK
jgi:DNA-binding PadR family transcriptional regulator